MTIAYHSTRGAAPRLNFEDAVLTGLATDGGLYLPESIPQFSHDDIAGFAKLNYVELAERILTPFTEGTLTKKELRDLLDASYATFRHPAIAPISQLSYNHFVLELFHGPTLAFKDFALQFLGNLFDFLLTRRGERAVILGATSGDTGSAAIAGNRGRKNIEIFILHPLGRTSDVQRKQMTTIQDKNVHNIAIKGTFDDCQDIVKALFGDAQFRTKNKLAAVNSINWARILAQVVYYFYAACAVGAPHRAVSFSVPTGNFGDIYAGYIAKRMGLPVEKLIIASNQNDILTRCVNSGSYNLTGVSPSLSPSMDIQVSSNFERLLFNLHKRDGARIRTMMKDFREQGTLKLAGDALKKLRTDFLGFRVDDTETLATIARIHADAGYLLDPHTAVGVHAAELSAPMLSTPVITLATAHPAKFPDAVKKATGIHPPLPKHLADLFSLPERFEVLENSVDAVRPCIEKLA